MGRVSIIKARSQRSFVLPNIPAPATAPPSTRPLGLAGVRTSCCYCDSSRASSCTHVLQTRHLRRGDAARSPTGPNTKRAIRSISNLPQSPFDCHRSVIVDVDIFYHARPKEPFIFAAPGKCPSCATPRGDASLRQTKKGIVLSHMGFCELELQFYTCSKSTCRVWVAAEGRADGLVILSSCTAASISLVRHFCQEVAVEGDAFAKVFRAWWVKARGRSRAGIFSRMSQSRGRRTVSRLQSVGLRLMGMDLPDWSLNCDNCCNDGRYRVVTADGIWLGFLRRLVTSYFHTNDEKCVPQADRLKTASLIAGESTRRFIRLCISHPEQSINVSADQRRAARMGLSLLCPAALPASVLATSLASDDIALRVKHLLAGIWQLPSCSVQLAKGLLAATTKVINAAVTANRPEQDIAAERELQTSLRAWLTTPHEDNCVPGAAAGGVVGPGLGGVVPAAPAAKSGALLPVAAALPPSIAPGFLQFCIAVFVDPVVAPFKPSHFGNLRRLVAELRSADAAARVAELSRAASDDISADGGDVNDRDAALVGMIRELKMVMVFLTALRRTGPALVRFSRLAADVLEDACSCIEAYHTTGSSVEGSVVAFEKSWWGTGKTAAEMRSFFLSQFPGASEDPLSTGMFFPGRQQ